MSTQNTEVRSSEIRALLNDTPSWFMKWGTVFILLAVISMGVVSWMIKYPDIVKASVMISTSTPPVPILSPMKGVLDEVFVEEGDTVTKGTPLAVFTSPGSRYADVLFLQAKLDVFNSKEPETFAEFEKFIEDPGNEYDTYSFGEIRPAFNELIGGLRAYAFESAGNQNRQIVEKEKEIAALKAEIKKDKPRIRDLAERLYLKIQTEKTEKDRYTGDNSIMDPKPWRDAKNAVSDAQAALDNFKSSIEFKESKVIQLGREIENLEAANDSGITRLLNEITTKQENLESEVERWKRTYLLYAPADGKVSFYKKENRDGKLLFDKDEKAMAILAPKKGAYIGEIMLDQKYNGKVVEGDKVLMKLHSFPYQEYGKLKGKVEHIPKVAQEDYYAVEVQLSEDVLKTTFGKIIPIDEKLFGTAEIITEEKRLFHRIYEQVF